MVTKYVFNAPDTLITFWLISIPEPDSATQTLLYYYKLTFNSSLKSHNKFLTQTHLLHFICRACLQYYITFFIFKLFNHYYSSTNSYLLKISVAPRFTISKYLGGDSAVLVVFHAHRHRASLDTCHMASRRVGDIDSIQSTARCPQCGATGMVIVDP